MGTIVWTVSGNSYDPFPIAMLYCWGKGVTGTCNSPLGLCTQQLFGPGLIKVGKCGAFSGTNGSETVVA